MSKESSPDEPTYRMQAAALLAWLKVQAKAHPRIVQAAGWLLLGFVLGWLAGCATFDAVYWCLQSAPGTGGPYCP